MGTSKVDTAAMCKHASIPTLAVFCLIAFANGFFINLRGPSLPALSKRVNVTMDDLGFMFVSNSVGGTAMALPSGLLTDWYGGRPIEVLGLLTRTISVAAVPLVSTLAAWCALALLQGISNPMVVTPTRAMIVNMSGRASGSVFSVTSTFFGLGSVAAPLMFVFCVDTWGEETGLDVCFIGLAAFTVLVTVLVAVIVKVPAVNTPPDAVVKEEAEEEEEEEGSSLVKEAGQHGRGRRIMLLICFYLGLGIGIEATFGSWLFAYCIETTHGGGLGLSHSHAAVLNSAFWLTFSLTRLFVFAPLAQHVSSASLLCASQFCDLLGMVILVLIRGSVLVAWIGTLLVGIGSAAFFPIGMGLAREYTQISGVRASMVEIAANAGLGLLPYLATALRPVAGPKSFIYVTTIATALQYLPLAVLVTCFSPLPVMEAQLDATESLLEPEHKGDSGVHDDSGRCRDLDAPQKQWSD